MLAPGFLSRRRRQNITAAHPNHLRAPSVYRAGRPGNMGKICRVPRIGHIDDRCPVGLRLAGQRIEPGSGMMAHIGNLPVTLVNDEGVISGAALQVVEANEFHIPGGLRVRRPWRRWSTYISSKGWRHQEKCRKAD